MDILVNAINELEKANLDRDKAIKLQSETMEKALESLSGEDKIKFQAVKNQLENSLQMVRNGGDVNAIVDSIKNIM